MALVLIVDDSPTEQHVFCEMLEKHGFETIVASDGEEAIETAERVQPAAIIMDVVMPGMDGHEVCRRLKNNPVTRDIPVIFVTGNISNEAEQHALELGAEACLGKPIDSGKLLEIVERTLS